MGIFKIESWVDLFGLCKENLKQKTAVTIHVTAVIFCLDKKSGAPSQRRPI